MFIKVFTDCARLLWNYPNVPRIIPATRYSYAPHRSFYRGMSLSEVSCFCPPAFPDAEPSGSLMVGAVVWRQRRAGRRLHFPGGEQSKLPPLPQCFSPQGWKCSLPGDVQHIDLVLYFVRVLILSPIFIFTLWRYKFLNSISYRHKIYYLGFTILWIWKNIKRRESGFYFYFPPQFINDPSHPKIELS